jgi:hypothetical protein
VNGTPQSMAPGSPGSRRAVAPGAPDEPATLEGLPLSRATTGFGRCVAQGPPGAGLVGPEQRQRCQPREENTMKHSTTGPWTLRRSHRPSCSTTTGSTGARSRSWPTSPTGSRAMCPGSTSRGVSPGCAGSSTRRCRTWAPSWGSSGSCRHCRDPGPQPGRVLPGRGPGHRHVEQDALLTAGRPEHRAVRGGPVLGPRRGHCPRCDGLHRPGLVLQRGLLPDLLPGDRRGRLSAPPGPGSILSPVLLAPLPATTRGETS